MCGAQHRCTAEVSAIFNLDSHCPAGTTAPLMFSIQYAAPEVVHAYEGGSKNIHVDAAVDIWAIGVTAFELLTGERAFPVQGLSAEEMEAAAQAAISGRKPLPWEGDGVEVKERLQKLRGVRRTALRCLDRNPANRPTAEELLQTWDSLFDATHTRGATMAPPSEGS